jgi:dolichyl-diphosphooligosaccharide--protein glycosyltransferase
MMTTLDAPYWLRWAREYNEGSFGKDRLRSYPSQSEQFHTASTLPEFIDPVPPSSSVNSKIEHREIPFLSFLIAHLASFFSYNYYLTGTLMIPVLASLFIIPLGIYFFQIGVPLSGLLGGLIGTFSAGYYFRSSIGRIDTDMLNLFFPVLAGLLILLASKAKTERSVLLYAIGAGLSLFLFQWWYGKAGFSLAYFMVFVFSLFIQKIRLRTILVGAFLFVLCAQPYNIMVGTSGVEGFLKGYFTIEDAREVLIDKGATPSSFPNTMTTISEVDHVPMDEVFRRVLSNITLDWIGFLGFFGLVIFRWRVLLPLAPILALGVLSFQSSNRFIMYLAPFIGIGLGWLLQLVVEGGFYVFTQRRKDVKLKEGTEALRHKGTGLKEGTKALRQKVGTEEKEFQGFKVSKFQSVDWWNWGRQIILYGGMGVFFWLISGQTGISFVPGPSIHKKLYATILEVKKRVPEDSVMLTWWDYGYAITDATELATFHDGGAQTSPKTYFIARGLIGSDPEELYDITQYLATKGNRGISENNTSPEALLAAVRNPKIKPWNPIYLFFTADMTGKYGAISKLGSWDIVNGGSKPRGYQNLACNKFTNEEMSCSGAKIDLKAGKINNQVPLKRMVFIRNGQVLREQEFGHAQGYTLQLLVSGQRIVEVQLIDDVVFRSNYNQMFLLGRYDRELFEETYNAFPFSRLYRVKF